MTLPNRDFMKPKSHAAQRAACNKSNMMDIVAALTRPLVSVVAVLRHTRDAGPSRARILRSCNVFHPKGKKGKGSGRETDGNGAPMWMKKQGGPHRQMERYICPRRRSRTQCPGSFRKKR